MADEMVKLILAWSSCVHYQEPGVYTRSVLVTVRSLSEENRTVTICDLTGEEATFEASYLAPADEGWELWRWEASGPELRGGPFKIRYWAGEKEYWDDNGGEGYALGDADGVLLGRDVNVRMWNAPLKNDIRGIWEQRALSNGLEDWYFFAVIAVRNIAYEKRVRVVYTTDSWRTQQTLSAGYFSHYYMFPPTPTGRYSLGTAGRGAWGVLPSPNQHGVEIWMLDAIFTPNEVVAGGAGRNRLEFAISYEVAGETYWDNNFGRNYVLTGQAAKLFG
jgi:Carbohydrate/starch-binding module (family 21)